LEETVEEVSLEDHLVDWRAGGEGKEGRKTKGDGESEVEGERGRRGRR
jgi:hypothetical protein